LGIYDFVDNMKKRFPNLVLENCSSGGQRMEPSMIIRSDMTSFSDAHETTAIPIIAANVTRMTLPRLSQIWAVVRRDDDDKRLFYSLAATFMGRMCLSGDLQKMDDRKLAIIKSAVDLYKDITDVIRNGRSSRHGPKIQSYNYPPGWQAVVRRSDSIGKTIVVAHTFANAPNPLQIPIRSVRPTQAKIKLFAEKNVVASLDDEKLTIEGLQDFSGCVVVRND
jgi:alpha-galactosidase